MPKISKYAEIDVTSAGVPKLAGVPKQKFSSSITILSNGREIF